jgi:glutamate dehydrogenase
VPVTFAAQAYFAIGERIGLAWVKEQVDALPSDAHWHAVARATLRDTSFALQRKITAAVLASHKGSAAARVESWLGGRRTEIASLDGLIADLRSSGGADFATLSVALQSIRRLAGE